ncbi:pentatricopeptide repeat-containing protein [Dorcoceras hygrometricum]|uniref:Pentatricopeptide repeat-containing protein n=1 Tax=Dorcoceras hygrometricum TaxID=472368 RepID=A0A2Z7C545_9LAMI|nr:pentatricopeptide repeat-containing protein [Dorcoceras hygrometricum]
MHAPSWMTAGRSSKILEKTIRNFQEFWEYSSISCCRERRSPFAHYTTSATKVPSLKVRSLSSPEFYSDFDGNFDLAPFLSFPSTYDYNVRMGELGRQGKLSAARSLFDEMPRRDSVSYASMIGIYVKHGEFHKAEEVFREIPRSMKSIVADSAMINAYARAGCMDKAKEIFEGMPVRNSFSWTSLISGFFKHGKVDDAVELFKKMPERVKNEITWTTVIIGYAQNGLIDDARGAFDQMPVKNIVAWTSMISVYANDDQVEEALKLFCMMPERNLYSWNVVIRGLLDAKRLSEANELFDTMPWRNAISWTTMVTGLARNGKTELARNYFNQMPYKDVSAWNAMITAYADEGCMTEAGDLFNMMSKRNIVTWNAMIDGYARHGHENESFKHFGLMMCGNIRPNEASLTSLLTSCSSILGVLQAHGLVVHLGLERETSLNNSLITMYYRSGDIVSAQSVFYHLEAKDVVSWTALILAYSDHGFGIQALQAFSQMLRIGHEPDEITFVGILSACSHSGLVKKGQMLFDSIRVAYGLEPRSEHFCCLVDLLGRAGLVNEAVKVVQEMPPDKYDGAVLGALLGACMLHGDVGVADHVGDELIGLEQAISGGYVSLANVYAASGRWDQFSRLRKTMKEKKVKKVPGCSKIEVNGENRTFFVGDRSHPETKEIYMLLQEKLLPLMQDIGYELARKPGIL